MGHARVIENQVVEANFGLATPFVVDPRPDPGQLDPDSSGGPVLSEPRTVRQIQSASQAQTDPPPFIGAGGGEVSPAQAATPNRTVSSRQPWLQAVELEVDDLLPALAEVFSSGVFEPDSGDPPPPLRRVPPAKATDSSPVGVTVKYPNLDNDPSSDGWSMWWWSLAPVTALAGGLWWRYGPSLPWRSNVRHFARRPNTRMK
jgi:hypothetical protein